MIKKIPTDLYYDLFTELSLKDIINTCNVNKSFKSFCLQNQKFIAKVKSNALKKFLKDNDDSIREFAFRNKLCFDKKSEKLAINKYLETHGRLTNFQSICTVENKFTVDLLYLVNNGLYDEAYVLLTCMDIIPPKGLHIFTSKLFDAFPERLLNIYMNSLPPILDLFGYDNVDDFYDDWPIENFKNKYLRDYIKTNI